MAINIICDVHIIWKLNMATRSNMVSYWLNLQTFWYPKPLVSWNWCMISF